jgi:hypothetical protein
MYDGVATRPLGAGFWLFPNGWVSGDFICQSAHAGWVRPRASYLHPVSRSSIWCATSPWCGSRKLSGTDGWVAVLYCFFILSLALEARRLRSMLFETLNSSPEAVQPPVHTSHGPRESTALPRASEGLTYAQASNMRARCCKKALSGEHSSHTKTM